MRYTWILVVALIAGLAVAACGAESPGAPAPSATPTWQQWLGQQIAGGRCPSPDHTMAYSNEDRTPPYSADFTCVAPTPRVNLTVEAAVEATLEAVGEELAEAGGTIIIEPSGGALLSSSSRVSCDAIFRNQLARQQAAYNAARMNQVKVQVQQRQEECGPEAWDPVVLEDVRHGGRSHGECIDWRTETVGGLSVPTGLEYFTLGKSPKTGRDGRNNIIVYFSERDDERPDDGAPCWMYVERLGFWVNGGE